MEVRIEHALEPDAIVERLAAAVREHDIELTAEGDGRAGQLEKATPLGTVRASYEIGADVVVVTVLQKPAFLPEGTVRRLLEENLAEALRG